VGVRSAANNSDSGSRDFEMSLDMLLKKEVQMWKGEKHDKMNDPEAKGDEQFEMEMDNKVMGGSESDYSSGNSDEGDKV